jgi:PD-(D/E)XK nuclease superfamily protein
MPWNYKAYGTASDPIHKSHLNNITGDYGCPRQFKYARDEAADVGPQDALTVSGRAAAGNAAHETIARALVKPDVVAKLLTGERVFSLDQIKAVYQQEFAREVGAREVRWRYDDTEADVTTERAVMVDGLLRGLHQYVASVVLVEGGFIAPCGEYWVSGHIDLLYRPRSNPHAYAIADWKTGASKPIDIELDHGWEAGIYSAAVRNGVFIKRDGLSRAQLEAALIGIATAEPHAHPGAFFHTFPSEIYHVHLGDFVPYKKAGTKEIKRPEDLRHHGYKYATKHKYIAGDLRGPGWLPVRVTEADLPRLEHRLRNVVGMIRMGRFIDQVGEKCRRCAYATDCLNTGYAARGDERKDLERALRGLDTIDFSHTGHNPT